MDMDEHARLRLWHIQNELLRVQEQLRLLDMVSQRQMMQNAPGQQRTTK